MPKLNKYGIVSGGYMFDWLDQYAVHALEVWYDNEYKYYLTSKARIQYFHQWTPPKQPAVLPDVKRSLWHKNKFYVTLVMFWGDNVLATAKFTMVGKNHLAVKPIKK